MSTAISDDRKQYKVGIVGFGVVGQRRKAIIDQFPQFKVTAICDTKPLSERNYLHYEEVLASDIDVLFVCLPNAFAAEVAMAGLKKGLHVFCEKPPGRSLQDIWNIMQLEKTASDSKLMFGFNHRHHESIREAHKILSSGELGKIINLKAVYGKSSINSPDSDWRSKRDLSGGGILLDQGIHMVDLIRMCIGELDEIHSFINNSFWQYDVEDNAYALMKTKENVVALLHSSATLWKHKFQIEIYLEKGVMTLEGIHSGSKSYGEETLTITKINNETTTLKFEHDHSWKREIEYFFDCITHDRKIEQGNSLEAFKTMETVFRIYCADKNWQNKYNLTASPQTS